MPYEKIDLAKPSVSEEDIRAVADVLRSGRLGLGPMGPAFEGALAKRAGTRHAVVVNSGTSALHLIVRGLGIGRGDEVITTPFSFVASTNCILFEGATPVFVDIEPDTLCIDPEAVEAAVTRRTRAILAVDVFGHPADWDALQAIARRHGLLLIEDSAEALGSELHGRPCGGFGHAGVFAFYPNKQITTGEGGAVVTNDEALAKQCRSMANQGRGAGGWLNHVQLGYNYRMDEMSAALGLSQLSRLDEFVAGRSRVAKWYAEALSSLSAVGVPSAKPGAAVSWFVYVVRLRGEFTRLDRDEILQRLRADGIGCRDYFQPIHLQPFARERLGTKEGDYPVTEAIGDRSIALPFYPGMSQGEVEWIAQRFERALRGLG